jgi:aspartate-semialdehyde dehydrogenase
MPDDRTTRLASLRFACGGRRGAVGRELLRVLADRKFPLAELQTDLRAALHREGRHQAADVTPSRSQR